MRVLDLFSGIGGFSLGLERTGGFRTVAFCEIDPYCRRVLAKHWPDVPVHDDITTREFQEGEADVITAGFPCQDLSYAGAGAGLSGARSGLYREVIRAVRVVRPRYAVLENVAALLGRGLGTVLGDLAAVGYDAEWHCIPASAVGAPHIRDRIWIIAKPQCSNSHLAGSHRAEKHERPFELRDEQGCVSGPLGQTLSDAKSERRRKARQLRRGQPAQRSGRLGEEMADASGAGLQGAGDVSQAPPRAAAGQSVLGSSGIGRQWLAEPDMGRVAHGIPDRVDRLRALGNAIVPQIAELIGSAILEAEASRAPAGRQAA